MNTGFLSSLSQNRFSPGVPANYPKDNNRYYHYPEAGEYIDYLENPGEMPNVTRILVSRGYSDEDIKKILGMNVLHLLEKVIG